MSQTRRVWLSAASLWVWGVAAVAVGLAVWHGLGILATPERSFFWLMTVADLVVAVVAIGLGLQWPRYADVEPEGIVVLRQRIRYDAITEIRIGDVSAKPFWVALWVPTSLVIGLIVALVRADTFNREVVEIATANGRARFRWRDLTRRELFLKTLREARPDLDTAYGLDGRARARDFTPRLSVGGGLLAAGALLWAFVAGWSGIQLFDQSTQRGPYSLQATSSVLQDVTSRFTGYDPLPEVSAGYTTWRCDRENYLLGPSPDVVDLHLKIEARGVPEAAADAVEAHVRQDAGMDPGEYLHQVSQDRDSDVEIDIPLVSSLYVEVSTGCVDSGDLPALRQDLDRVARALGVGR